MSWTRDEVGLGLEILFVYLILGSGGHGTLLEETKRRQSPKGELMNPTATTRVEGITLELIERKRRMYVHCNITCQRFMMMMGPTHPRPKRK
jgi:hypothetical protein